MTHGHKERSFLSAQTSSGAKNLFRFTDMEPEEEAVGPNRRKLIIVLVLIGILLIVIAAVAVVLVVVLTKQTKKDDGEYSFLRIF